MEEIKEKKKRGRPKKEKVEVVQDVDKEIQEVEKELAVEVPIENPVVEEKRELPPLADTVEYPSKEEEEIQKQLEEDKSKGTLPEVKLEETPETKKFLGKVFKKNKLKKENSVAVLVLHRTTNATMQIVQAEDDGTFKVADNQYHINEHCVYSIMVKKVRYPLCILPEWTMIPIGTKAWFELSQERRGHELERILLEAIKKEEAIKAEDQLKKKGGMSGKTMWIILGVLVIGYIYLKSTGKL